jgi:two-component system, NtrC family, nitrogen regulation response regulator GlnG
MGESIRSVNLLDLPYKEARFKMLKKFQRFYFNSIIDRFGGNITKASYWMGIPRTTIYRALRKK